VKRGFPFVVAVALVLTTSVFTSTASTDFVLQDLTRYADEQLRTDFAQVGEALYTSCPYALGTYSLIELEGIRRIYRALKPDPEDERAGITAQRELTLQPKKVRYYWELGHKWIDGSQAPSLHYFADLRDGKWWFTAEQHICARGEPQRKPVTSNIPLK
jgi:hypothetical protein